MKTRLFLTLALAANTAIATVCHWQVWNRILVLLNASALLVLIVRKLQGKE